MAQNKPPMDNVPVRPLSSSLSAVRPLLRRGSSFKPFQRTWSTDHLIPWLHERGLGAKDCDRLREEEFTGESFLLLTKSDLRELGIKAAGQMLLGRIIEEVSYEIEREESLMETEASNPSDATTHSQRVTNNLGGPTTQDTSMQTSPRTLATGSNVITNQLSIDKDFSSEVSETHNDELREDPTPLATPSSNQSEQSQKNEDVVREEEVPPYCTTGPYEGSSVFSYDHTIYMYRDKVWAGRQVLRVFFMNPEVLREWELTEDTIIEWAMAWRHCDDERIPLFQQTSGIKKADVRVKFSDTEGCWSMVGMDAEKMVGHDKPTMVLNLKSYTTELRRSLVIHEFGHALGLDHEHQRSNFWDVVGDCFDMSKIPQDQKARVKKRDEKVERGESCPYDHESIMHYWFNLDWLKKPEHRDVSKVMNDNGLTSDQRTYLMGVHKRQRSALLPNCPSKSDFEHLLVAYVNLDPREVSSTISHAVQSTASTPSLQTSKMGSSFSENERNVLQVNVHLQSILRAIWEARILWREIGLGLGLSQYDLDALEGDSRSKLENVLSIWMHQGNTTIDQLLSVLKSPLVNKPGIADEILKTKGLIGMRLD